LQEETNIYFAGIDIGSTMTKVIILEDKDKVCSKVVGPTGAEHRRLANRVTHDALEHAGISIDEVAYIVATGYGRISVPFADRQITELTCHAKGISTLFPTARTAIDIGGQDAKGLKISNGKLVDFVMNDKCAAGTGRFLEVIAEALSIRVEDLGTISLQSTNKITISNTCTIFAQQEITSCLSDGIPLEDILAGLHDAIATRVIGMVKRLGIQPSVVLTGGVAKNIGIIKAMEENLGHTLLVPEDPLFSGALGAAILGREFVMQSLAEGTDAPKKERHLEAITFFSQEN